MQTMLQPCPASLILGLNVETPARPLKRTLRRVRGEVVYWHVVDGKTANWGVIRSDARTKYFAHLSQFKNANKPPPRGQRVEFTPRPPRLAGQLRQAVDVFVESESLKM
jgi:hypothetical protein